MRHQTQKVNCHQINIGKINGEKMKKLLIILLLLPNCSFAYYDKTTDNPDAVYLNHPQTRKVVDAECYSNCVVDGQPQMQCDNECSHYEETN